MGYSFRLAARVLLYAPSYRQDSTCHGLWYTSRGALAGTRNGSTMKDRSDNRTHDERTLLPMSYISLRHMKGRNERRKEGKVLFNTFYLLRLCDVGYIVNGHSAREETCCRHIIAKLLFPISSKGSFICTIPGTWQCIPRPLLHDFQSSGWNE